VLGSIDGSDGGLCFSVVGHLDEAEPTGTTCLTIRDELDRGDLSVYFKKLSKGLLRGGVGYIADIDVHELSTCRWPALLAPARRFAGEFFSRKSLCDLPALLI
jgi:hypothetical protein